MIDIDRRTYFPLRVVESPAQIRESCIGEYKELFDHYRGKGLFYVHRNSYPVTGDRGRHHAIDVDLTSILNDERFIARLQTVLAGIEVRPSLIVVPPHSPGIAFANKVQACFDTQGLAQVPICKHTTLDLRNDNIDDF